MSNQQEAEHHNITYGAISVKEGTTSNSTTRDGEKMSLLKRRRSSAQIYLSFLGDFRGANGGWQIILIGMLIGVGMGSMIGIIPQIATQQYAEELFDHNKNDQACNSYAINDKPSACALGANYAQSAASFCAMARNIISLLCNPIVGSYSDIHGRRGVHIFGLFLSTLSPVALLLVQTFNFFRPSWYFAFDAVTSVVSTFSVAYSELTDLFPARHRAASFGLYFGAFFAGLAIAPFFAVFLTHLQVTIVSILLRAVTLCFCMVALPETLPLDVATQNKQAAIEKGPAGNIVLRPFIEMSILTRNWSLVLLTIGAFMSKFVFSADTTLFFYYTETELGVHDNDIAGMMLVTGVLGILVQAVFLKYLISLLGERGLLITSYCSGVIHNLIYGLAPNKWVLYIGICLACISNTSGPLLSSLASRSVSKGEQGRMQGALFALAALAEAVGPICFNYVYRNWHLFGRGTMFVIGAIFYAFGTLVIMYIPAKGATDGDRRDNDDCDDDASLIS